MTKRHSSKGASKDLDFQAPFSDRWISRISFMMSIDPNWR